MNCTPCAGRPSGATATRRLVQQYAASFIVHGGASTGGELPQFIKHEFDAVLECGIAAHGFLRLGCRVGTHTV